MIDNESILRHPILRRVPRERLRVYRGSEVSSFWFTSAEFGEFSNMSEGFPLSVSGAEFQSAEALYQACRFPDHPELQRQIANAGFAKRAKQISRANTPKTRADWLQVRTDVMRWVLRIKAVQHKKDFLFALSQTGDVQIVEESTKDAFWGAIRLGDYLVGMNVLGRLLMELRRDANAPGTNLMKVDPPEISNFRMFGGVVGVVGPNLGPRT